MSILTALPEIRPTLRSFVMDEWPQGGAKMRGGRSVRWAQVSAPAGAAMELAWENITYAQAQQIATVWDASYGIYGNLTLSASTIAGLDPTLAALIEEPFPGALWRFQGPPVVESVKTGRCTVRLQLRTRYDLTPGLLPVEPPGKAFFIMIGSPYFSLDIPDPSASYDSLDGVLGCQTVSYVPDVGIIVQNGGAISRNEQAGDTTYVVYQELALYDTDGNFIQRINYQRPFTGTYYYTFEAPRFHVRLSDGRLLAILGSGSGGMQAVAVNADLTSPTRLAFSGVSGSFQAISVNSVNGRVLMQCFQFDSTDIWALSSALAPNWGFRYINATAGYSTSLRGYDNFSTVIAGLERNCASGFCRFSATNKVRAFLLLLDSTGSILNAWSYHNTSAYMDDRSSFEHVGESSYYIQKSSDDNLTISGITTLEPVEYIDEGFPYIIAPAGAYIAKINPANGDVIQAFAVVPVNQFQHYGTNFFGTPKHVVDSDGSTYLAYGCYFGPPLAPTYNGYGTLVVKLSVDFTLQSALMIFTETSDIAIEGIALADDKVLLSGYCYNGSWGVASSNEPQDSMVAVIDKTAFAEDNDATGSYWVTEIAGGPAAFRIANATEYHETRAITLTKTNLTVTRSTLSIAVGSATNYASTNKEPASVVLNKVA